MCLLPALKKSSLYLYRLHSYVVGYHLHNFLCLYLPWWRKSLFKKCWIKVDPKSNTVLQKQFQTIHYMECWFLLFFFYSVDNHKLVRVRVDLNRMRQTLQWEVDGWELLIDMCVYRCVCVRGFSWLNKTNVMPEIRPDVVATS